MLPSPPERRHDLDWLRALAILLVVVFHSAMPYVAEWGCHVENAERSELLLEMNWFLSRWRMALRFLIAGADTTWALGARGARRERIAAPLARAAAGPLLWAPAVALGLVLALMLPRWPGARPTSRGA